MKLRTILCLLLALGMFSPVQAVTIKLATIAPDGSSWMRELKAAAARVKEKTDGRVSIKFYPGGVMGNAETVLRKIRVGQIQGGAFTFGELSVVYPDFYLYGAPFLFRNQQEVDYVREKLDPKLIDGLSERGLELLGMSGAGFAYIMSDHDVSTVDLLRDSKVWVPKGDVISIKTMEEGGIAPIALNIADVYTGLQTGLIDTVMNTTVGAIAFQWHSKMRYRLDLPVAYAVGTLVVDNRTMRKLSQEDAEITRKEIWDTMVELEKINLADNKDAAVALDNQGIELIELDNEQLSWWEGVGRTALTNYSENVSAFELLEEVLNILDEYRNGSG